MRLKETPLGAIPDDWETCSIGDVTVTAQYGLSIRGESSGRFPILRMNCQVDGEVSLHDLQYVDVDARTLEAFALNAGDILFNRTNSYELVGRSAVFDHDVKAVFASYLVRLAVNRSRVDPHFLNFLINWDVAQRELKKLASRAVSQANISASKLKEFSVHLPRFQEQQAIAQVLRDVRKHIAKEHLLEERSKVLKGTMLSEVFSRGLLAEEQKETVLGPTPQSWEVAPLRAHHSVVSGGTPSRSNSAFWTGGTIPWVKTAEVDYRVITATEEQITPQGLAGSATKMLPVGTLLMAMYGQGITRGKVAMLGIEACCNQACAAISQSDDSVLPRFLYHFLTWRYEAIRSLAHGGQQQNLNLDIVRDLPIVYPRSKDEQQQIVVILDAIDRKVDLHRRKRDVLEDLFKSLLHKLMTGEIRVGELEISTLRVATTKGEEVPA